MRAIKLRKNFEGENDDSVALIMIELFCKVVIVIALVLVEYSAF